MIFTEECLHSEMFPRKCSTKMSKNTRISAERWCVEVNKDGEEGISKENTTGVQNPQYRITTESSRIQYYGTGENAGEVSRTTHTHTVWSDPKAKQGLLSFQFSFHFLYCYYSMEPPAGGRGISELLHWGRELPDGCMNNIFGHNGKQSIGRLICSGPRIGSNRTAAIQAITARVRPITAHHLRCHWPLIHPITGLC